MIRASSILFWSALTIAASVGLYHTSYRVHDLSEQLRSLNAKIEAEQRNLHVLKAEWVYLSNPTKIEQATRKYLTLQPTQLQQIARTSAIPDLLPTRSEAMADMTVTHAPLAVGNSMAMPVALAVPAAKPKKPEAPDDRAHINTHMTMQHTADAATTLDRSYALTSYGTRP